MRGRNFGLSTNDLQSEIWVHTYESYREDMSIGNGRNRVNEKEHDDWRFLSFEPCPMFSTVRQVFVRWLLCNGHRLLDGSSTFSPQL